MLGMAMESNDLNRTTEASTRSSASISLLRLSVSRRASFSPNV